MQNVAAEFTINQTSPINAEFSIEQSPAIATIFELNTAFTVVGEGVINTAESGGVITVTSTTYVHEQGIASDTWEINHNLNKYPSVALVDSAGTQFQGRIEYINENTCIAYMNGATKGKAFLN